MRVTLPLVRVIGTPIRRNFLRHLLRQGPAAAISEYNFDVSVGVSATNLVAFVRTRAILIVEFHRLWMRVSVRIVATETIVIAGALFLM
jgi:hypothetical protein